LAAVNAVSSAIDAALEMPLQIPIVSWLYKEATGSELTLLDATCLLLGIGITLVYKIATNESPVEPLRQAPTSGAIGKVFEGFDSAQPQTASQAKPASSTTNGTVGVRVNRVDAAPVSMLQKLSGCILLTQSVTQSVWGGAVRQHGVLSSLSYPPQAVSGVTPSPITMWHGSWYRLKK
jgi:hypothetical protein